jgi:hypothetical protein
MAEMLARWERGKIPKTRGDTDVLDDDPWRSDVVKVRGQGRLRP